MKQLTFLSKLLMIAILATMITSCEDETPGGGGFDLPPVVDLQSGVDVVTSSATVAPGEIFKVSILADKGDNDMSTLVILEDGFEVDASRINYNGIGAGTFANPYTFTAAEATSFASEIEIMAHDSGLRTYTFRVTDTQGETAETTVDIDIISDPLSVTFTEMAPFNFTDLVLPAQSTVKFQVNGTKGPFDMETISVLEDGVEITDLSRIRYNVIDDIASAITATENPVLLTGDDRASFSWVMWVGTHADNSTKSYTFRVTDANGDSQEVGINITINTGTPITSDLTGKLLLNAGGPAGTGGINLLTGDGTGSNDMMAHLKDQGIDTSQPVASNWVRKIAPGNAATSLRKPASDFPAGGFGLIQFQEEIQLAFDAGTDISESDLVLVGDVFLVQATTGEIFIVEITGVNETTGDNDDYYELAIKR